MYDEYLVLSTALVIGSNLVLEYKLDGFEACIESGKLRVTAIRMVENEIIHSNKSETIYNIQYSPSDLILIILSLVRSAAEALTTELGENNEW